MRFFSHTCPKCSGDMYGPQYESRGNRLRWFCFCGYSRSELAHDAKPAIGITAAEVAEDLAARERRGL